MSEERPTVTREDRIRQWVEQELQDARANLEQQLLATSELIEQVLRQSSESAQVSFDALAILGRGGVIRSFELNRLDGRTWDPPSSRYWEWDVRNAVAGRLTDAGQSVPIIPELKWSERYRVTLIVEPTSAEAGDAQA